MEIRSVSSIPANRPAAAAVASATVSPANAYAAARSPGSNDGQSNGGFISPVLRYDQMARVAVLYYRDTDTGETKDQIPAERVVEEYRRNAVRLASGAGESPDRAGTPTGSGAAEPGASGAFFTPTSDGASGVASAPATVPGYAAAPAPGGFSGAGASVSAGTSGGGAPGGLVSVTV